MTYALVTLLMAAPVIFFITAHALRVRKTYLRVYHMLEVSRLDRGVIFTSLVRQFNIDCALKILRHVEDNIDRYKRSYHGSYYHRISRGSCIIARLAEVKEVFLADKVSITSHDDDRKQGAGS